MRFVPPSRAVGPRRGFTLVELLVVVGIIAVLIAILLPTLNKARAAAESAKCLSNLHQLGIATAQYESDTKGYLPYPTSTLSGDPKTLPDGSTRDTTAENMVWYNVLDPYLQSVSMKNVVTSNQAARHYTAIKQCPVWQTWGSIDPLATAQNTTVGATRTYKMNSNLRLNNAFNLPDGLGGTPYTYRPAKVIQVPNGGNFVYLGDGIGIDTVGPIPNFTEGNQFDMDVNQLKYGSPALRHSSGANILFVDLHAAHQVLAKLKKPLSSPLSTTFIDGWHTEYLKAGAETYSPNIHLSMDAQGLTRNPLMPLQWSYLGRFYHP